ncbi:LysR family transcriptional regulator [Sphingomonas quercus]|uniref:LysR family transcriptional regulator n=1 Tax=Sphingomonas quercus TaxID=2842451 RepID=A0ABS6BHU7_9SPHN|nr:LysR substrate-binding domain-containing protein [Sphingomonas quercus]MBU3077880.1 LysR family transcriptional regulator [Sphingomonas quercus]
MRVDVEWLEDYLLLLEEGGFSRAADRRELSQPAFSRRIQALESWMGTPLLVRGSHKLTLTTAGERFRPLSEALLLRINAARMEVREAAASSKTEVRFASTPALSQAYFSSWIRGLEAGDPLQSMVLSVDTLTACERSLLHGEVHFVLCHHHEDVRTPLDTSEFLTAQMDDDPLVALSAPDATGAPLFKLPGTENRPVRFLNYTRESGLFRIIETVRNNSRLNVNLDQVFASPSSMVLAAMARDGRGVAWIPRLLAQDDIAAGRLVPVGDARSDIATEIRLIRPRHRQSQAAENFWSKVIKYSKMKH